jgi:hypothetical protein
MKKNFCLLVLTAFLVNGAIAQEDGYLVQPIMKTYTKLRNPLIKKNVAVDVLVINGKAYLDGDIYLGTTADLDTYQNSFQIQSVTNDFGRWPNGIVPFQILDGFTEAERQTIIDGLNHIASLTHVCFRYRNNEADYIKFRKVTQQELGYKGGRSELGRVGGGQEIVISTDAVTNKTVRHEVCHALGLLHEQSREDRNSFVKILYDNIEFPYGLGNNFSQAVYTSSDIGSYDFNSIMHYRHNAFGKKVNGVQLSTIQKISAPKETDFGISSSLSSGDIAGINSMYPTEQSCATLTNLAPGELIVGASKTMNISAGDAYNLTGVYVRQGQKFEFTTSSPGWNNGTKETTCNGYDGIPVIDLPRHLDIKMMALVGEIFNQNNESSYTGTYFKIGCGPTTLTMQKTGFLVCFANDIITGYGDNSRVVTLTVKRVL